jgi:hypothetical protein
LLGLPVRKQLKKTAVPSLNLPQISKDEKNVTVREERYLKKKEENERKEEINRLIAEESKASSSTALLTLNEPLAASSADEFNSNNSDKPLTVSAENISEQYSKLRASHTKLCKEMEIMKRKLSLQRKQLLYYKKKNKEDKPPQSQEALTLLKKLLTENQIAILLNKKKRVNWTTEEIAVAFTVRYLSKKCYIFLRTKLNFPLPALSTLRSWASKISIKPGVLKDVLTFLKVAGENMSAKEKTVVFSFDEVKVLSTFEYDVGEDQVLGPYNLMQVCMVRSLFSTWKQPIYLDFDQKMTRDVLMDIISQLHKLSYNCVAIVSDCGSSNVGLWKDLSVDINKTYFEHPQVKKNIYVFADAPHLLKLFRNWILDKGFILKSDGNKKIRKEPLESLIQLTNTEVNSCYKIWKNTLQLKKVNDKT